MTLALARVITFGLKIITSGNDKNCTHLLADNIKDTLLQAN